MIISTHEVLVTINTKQEYDILSISMFYMYTCIFKKFPKDVAGPETTLSSESLTLTFAQHEIGARGWFLRAWAVRTLTFSSAS